MQKELYFDISSEQSGGSLFRIERDGKKVFYYNHSTYNDTSDELKVFETYYNSFSDFWQELVKKQRVVLPAPFICACRTTGFCARTIKDRKLGLTP